MDIQNVKRIKMLPIQETFFLKKVNLQNTYDSGVLCYARSIFDGYKIERSKEAKQDDNFWGVKENEYPSDILDKKILSFIQEKFPQAECHTSLMMLDIEKSRNLQWIEQSEKDVLHIAIEYIPTEYPYTGAEIYQKDVEVFYVPSMKGRQKRLNTNITISTEQRDEYNELCALLKETYILFTNACKIN